MPYCITSQYVHLCTARPCTTLTPSARTSASPSPAALRGDLEGGPAEEAGHLAPQLVDLLPRGEAKSLGVGGRCVARLFRRSLCERRSRLRLQCERALNLRVPLVPAF